MTPVSDLMMRTLPQAQINSAISTVQYQWEYLFPIADIWQDVQQNLTGTVFVANTKNTWLRRNVEFNADHQEDVQQNSLMKLLAVRFDLI